MSHNEIPLLARKFACDLNNKESYVVQIRNLQQVLNPELKLQTVQKVIKFNKKEWLKPYVALNTELRKKKIQKMTIKNIFFS